MANSYLLFRGRGVSSARTENKGLVQQFNTSAMEPIARTLRMRKHLNKETRGADEKFSRSFKDGGQDLVEIFARIFSHCLDVLAQ